MRNRKADYDFARRVPRLWVCLAALALCVGQTVADAHAHLDEREGDACTVCAISESGHVPDGGRVDVLPSQWRRSASLPVYSATLPHRPYAVGQPRAPPIS